MRISRRLGRSLVAAALSIPLPALGQGADGRCQTGAFRFSFENEDIATRQVVPAAGCTTGFGGGISVSFETVTFVRRPASMSVEPRTNGFAWVLRPRGGFRGQDSYAVKVCGTYGARKGCSTIRYDVTIN